MTVEDVKESYTAFHLSHNPAHVYPSEWVIRTLLGNYPRLSLDKSKYRGAKILDVGFGDGRNWPLLDNCGFRIHGVEITEEIIALGLERARALGIDAALKLGKNSAIPFADDFFDYALASSSCYYVDKGTSFSDNLAEYSRVLKPGGILLATLPEAGSSIFDGCAELDEGHVEIRNDPWGLRNGYIFRRFHTEEELVETFSSRFDSFSVGLCRDNYYGVQINLFLLVCRKKS
ncbi:MAG TPA: class I SAM-dependent methyltransferase [Pyrinomonadaceae bacterium]|nr:class I SAM-dependent methyltransferase [Pyrinomonadaceae bacterium]